MQELLTAALASEWTPKQALTLERTENVESVVDAVQRVASHLPQVLPSPGQLHASDAASYVGHAVDQDIKLKCSETWSSQCLASMVKAERGMLGHDRMQIAN